MTTTTTTHILTQPDEAIGLLLQELQGNTTQAQQLREALKKPQTYNDLTIWQAAVVKPLVMNAFGRLRENLPESTYAARARRRFSINPDALGLGFTNTILASPTAVDDNRKSASHVMQWLDLGDTTVGPAEIAFLDATRRKIAISAAGLYSINASFCLGFFPTTSMAASFDDQTITYTNGTMKGVGVKIFLEVWQGNTMEYVLPLAECMLSRADMFDRRRRFVGGSKDIQLTAGSSVRIVIQRDSRLGRYSKLNVGNPIPVMSNEGIGFSKFIPVDAANQQRDTQNWLEIVRLA